MASAGVRTSVEVIVCTDCWSTDLRAVPAVPAVLGHAVAEMAV